MKKGLIPIAAIVSASGLGMGASQVAEAQSLDIRQPMLALAMSLEMTAETQAPANSAAPEHPERTLASSEENPPTAFKARNQDDGASGSQEKGDIAQLENSSQAPSDQPQSHPVASGSEEQNNAKQPEPKIEPSAEANSAAAPAQGLTEAQPQNSGQASSDQPQTLAAPSEAGPSSAQANTAESGGIETVVVTARRTAENLQKVPIAVTAFSSKDLERQKISSAQDLNGIVPSLVVNTGGTQRNVETPTIRGQGATFGASPGVIIYYAEVPLPSDTFNNAQGGPGKFFDLADLQVLKGSQGTLFGRNTTGGALLLEPHKPDPYFSASVKGELGDLSAKGMEGVLNLPLIEDQLFLRVGAKYYEREGFTTNIANGLDLDNKGYRTMRLGLMWKPTTGVQNYVLSYYSHNADNGTSQVIEQFNPEPVQIGALSVNVGCAFVAASQTTNISNLFSNYQNCGRDIIVAQQARGVRAVDLSSMPSDILDTGGVIDSFSYDFVDNLTLRNIASYQMYKHHFGWDQDGSVLPLNDFNPPTNINSSDIESYTEELQIQGRAFDNQLKYVTGLYYQEIGPGGPQENVSNEFGFEKTDATSNIKTRSFGPYAQGTYDMGGLSDYLDGLSVTTGARYTQDSASGDSLSTTATEIPAFVPFANQLANVISLPPSVTSHSDNVKSSAPTYTLDVDYKVPTTLLYGKVSRGYKSGGISPTAVTESRFTYKPEYVMNYEIGHKSDFNIGDMPMRVNSALYYTDYSDIQKVVTDNNGRAFGAATINAAKATIYGFETEITLQPVDGLTLLANYSYTYAKYGDFNLQLVLPVAILTEEDCTGKQILSGQQMQLQCIPFAYVPKHQASMTARYQLPVEESLGKMEGSVTYSFTDRQYTSNATVPDAEPGAWLGAYGLLNASFGWSSIYGRPFDLQLFGSNLTDRTYRISNSNVWNYLYFQSSIYGEPRTFGVQLSYHWE